MNQVFYRPSGQVPASTVLALIASLVLALPGALAYAWACARTPWFLSILTIWPFVVCLGCLAKWSCLLAKVRNPLIMKEFGAVLGAWGWATHWVFWIVFVSYPSTGSMPGSSILIPIADLFAEPLAPLRALQTAFDAIEWGDDADVDILRGVGWIFEGAILVVTTSLAGAVQAERPFCEASGRWAAVTRLPFMFAADHLAKARAHLVAHPDQLLAALVPARSSKRYAMVNLFRGQEVAYLSVNVFDSWMSEKRHMQRRDKLVRYCLVPKKVADGFLARVHRQMRNNGVARPVSLNTRFLLWLEDQLEPSLDDTCRAFNSDDA